MWTKVIFATLVSLPASSLLYINKNNSPHHFIGSRIYIEPYIEMNEQDANYQLWGGCFEEKPSSVLRRLNDSLAIDCRLFKEDIRGSRSWARELCCSNHITQEDEHLIQQGLDKVEKEITQELCQNGKLADEEEDIHSVVESRLYKHIGESALRLHTARSRNDQSATNTKLWMLFTALPNLESAVIKLITVLMNRAGSEKNIIAPGYTHLQRAQPVRWSHFLLSNAWFLRDDVARLREQRGRLSKCPLGSGALAGCALAIDRKRLARDLGFDDITPNSMFAVASRDHIVEFLNWASLCGLHLSKLAEDLIIYSSHEFGIVSFSDQFSTGSSLMPQKRNPDGMELIRGAAGLLLGDSLAIGCVLKGLPSTYNKDLQYDKELIFKSYDRLLDCLKVAIGTIQTMEVNANRAVGCLGSAMLATDLAHMLVRNGVPFRRAHHLVGAAIKRAGTLKMELQKLPHNEYMSISPDFGKEEDLKKVFSWEASVEQYTTLGGTAQACIENQIKELTSWIEKNNT